MGRIYTVPFTKSAVTTSMDAWEVVPGDDKTLLIHEIEIYQTSEIGDAQEEQLAVSIIRDYTTSGSGGSAVTPVKQNKDDAAAGFPAEAGNTTVASAGTPETTHECGFNVRTGFDKVFTPETRPRIGGGET